MMLRGVVRRAARCFMPTCKARAMFFERISLALTTLLISLSFFTWGLADIVCLSKFVPLQQDGVWREVNACVVGAFRVITAVIGGVAVFCFSSPSGAKVLYVGCVVYVVASTIKIASQWLEWALALSGVSGKLSGPWHPTGDDIWVMVRSTLQWIGFCLFSFSFLISALGSMEKVLAVGGSGWEWKNFVEVVRQQLDEEDESRRRLFQPPHTEDSSLTAATAAVAKCGEGAQVKNFNAHKTQHHRHKAATKMAVTDRTVMAAADASVRKTPSSSSMTAAVYDYDDDEGEGNEAQLSRMGMRREGGLLSTTTAVGREVGGTFARYSRETKQQTALRHTSGHNGDQEEERTYSDSADVVVPPPHNHHHYHPSVGRYPTRRGYDMSSSVVVASRHHPHYHHHQYQQKRHHDRNFCYASRYENRDSRGRRRQKLPACQVSSRMTERRRGIETARDVYNNRGSRRRLYDDLHSYKHGYYDGDNDDVSRQEVDEDRYWDNGLRDEYGMDGEDSPAAWLQPKPNFGPIAVWLKRAATRLSRRAASRRLKTDQETGGREVAAGNDTVSKGGLEDDEDAENQPRLSDGEDEHPRAAASCVNQAAVRLPPRHDDDDSQRGISSPAVQLGRRIVCRSGETSSSSSSSTSSWLPNSSGHAAVGRGDSTGGGSLLSAVEGEVVSVVTFGGCGGAAEEGSVHGCLSLEDSLQ